MSEWHKYTILFSSVLSLNIPGEQVIYISDPEWLKYINSFSIVLSLNIPGEKEISISVWVALVHQFIPHCLIP